MPDPTEQAHRPLPRERRAGDLPSQALAHRESITAPDTDDLRRVESDFARKMHAQKTSTRREPKRHAAVGGYRKSRGGQVMDAA